MPTAGPSSELLGYLRPSVSRSIAVGLVKRAAEGHRHCDVEEYQEWPAREGRRPGHALGALGRAVGVFPDHRTDPVV